MATTESDTDDGEEKYTRLTLYEDDQGRRSVKPGEHGNTFRIDDGDLVGDDVYAIVPLDSPKTWDEIADDGVEELPTAAREFLQGDN